MRKLCKALEEDAFRPVLHHYDGPKFRLELSVPEVNSANLYSSQALISALEHTCYVSVCIIFLHE